MQLEIIWNNWFFLWNIYFWKCASYWLFYFTWAFD